MFFSRREVDNDILLILSVIYEVNKYNWKPTPKRNNELDSSHLCPSNMTLRSSRAEPLIPIHKSETMQHKYKETRGIWSHTLY